MNTRFSYSPDSSYSPNDSHLAWIRKYRSLHGVSLRDAVKAWNTAYPGEKPIGTGPEQEPAPVPATVSLDTVAAAIKEVEPARESWSHFENGVKCARKEIAGKIASLISDPAARAAFLGACGIE